MEMRKRPPVDYNEGGQEVIVVKEVLVVVEEEDDEEEEGSYQRNGIETEDNEQPSSSRATREGEHNGSQQPLPKTKTLLVTCGNQEGFLDREKFENGEACIKCGDKWLLPREFEENGGRGSSKKWKASIYCEDKPLQYWIESVRVTLRRMVRMKTGFQTAMS
ncbi:sp110 nuclear body protein-like [Halichoeres trimaculatus]|uniref:sp110 nuclear body protein-like n=1 Tax=Halichoeres trimaculatus TaxID=147232 RepID=UPI003D9F5AAF